MELIADIMLVAGALGAGFYCFVLARRLTRFNDLESGVGGAVAVLSAQVDDLARTLNAAQKAAGASSGSLEALTDRAEEVARRLELLVASMHDLPAEQEQEQDRNGRQTPDPDAPRAERPGKNGERPERPVRSDRDGSDSAAEAPVFARRAR